MDDQNAHHSENPEAAAPGSRQALEAMIEGMMDKITDDTKYGKLLSKKVDIMLSGKMTEYSSLRKFGAFPTAGQETIIDLLNGGKLIYEVEDITGLSRRYILETISAAKLLDVPIPDIRPRAELHPPKRARQRYHRKGVPNRVREHMARAGYEPHARKEVDSKPLIRLELPPKPSTLQPMLKQAQLPLPAPAPQKHEPTMEIKIRVTQSQMKEIMAIIERK